MSPTAPASVPFLPWNQPSIGEEEITEVTDTLRSGWLTYGPKAARFEDAVRDALGVQDAFAVSSCTAALHLAFLALGLGPGDEVITPSFTFCAAPNALLQVGARPVFVDIEDATLNIAPDAAEAAITDRTKAIVVMHYGGHPCDLTAFRKLADDHGLILIEDAAHALHASRDGYRAGGDTVIGNDVWIGMEAVMLPGVRIGDGAIVGAKSVVTHDVPPYAIFAGNPARVVKMRFDEATVVRLLEVAWWNWPVDRISRNLDAIRGADISRLEEAV